MKIAIVLNSIALHKKKFLNKTLPILQKDFDIDLYETSSKDDAISLGRHAADKGYDIIMAAGGDGTLNQVINGALQSNESTNLPIFGIIPIGSGNDFARAVKYNPDISQLIAMINKARYELIDIGKATCIPLPGANSANPIVRYFINEVDIGMGPYVVEKVMQSRRRLGGGFAYYHAILSTFFTYQPLPVSLLTPFWNWKGFIRSLAITNGKCFGHGLVIAPEAKINDGIFSVFIAGKVSVLDFIRFSGQLKKGRKVNHKEVWYKEASSFELSSERSCLLEVDGELIGMLPAKVDLMRSRIRFLR